MAISIYKNAIRDARIREYLPVHRVMLAEQAQNAEILPGNPAIQPSISGSERLCILQPGGALLLDFGVVFVATR